MRVIQLKVSSKWLLAAVFGIAALVLFSYLSGSSPESLVVSGVVFTLLITLLYEPINRAIQSLTGHLIGDKGLEFFSVLSEFNKRIHSLLTVDGVLVELNNVLREQAGFSNVVFMVDENYLESVVDSEEVTLLPWDEAGESITLGGMDVDNHFHQGPSVILSTNADLQLKSCLDEAGCNIALPVVVNEKLVCLILLNKPQIQNESDLAFNGQMFTYLANQLSLVFDRIRVYRNSMAQTQLLHAEKLHVMQGLSANIAHEMRTPLSGIRASISGIDNYLPKLMESYEYACLHSEGFQSIHGLHLASLKATPDRIMLMIDQANAVIDMLLMNLREQPYENQEECSAANCVTESIERYPFKTGEREKLSLSLDDDFDFSGSELLCVYVLFNLLKNALYSIRSAQKGEIEISFRTDVEGANQIIFRDGGVGIKKEVVAKVFDNFFTTKEEGTGVGLTFCKKTMEGFGGSISCCSELGLYTEFRLIFPILDSTSEISH